VLLLGQTGTGQELVARAIHGLGHRRSKPFVVVNCAGVTESLVESAFFGHRRGSFTGALTDQRGLVHAADGGTLFLDEIGDASGELQAQLLRVLEDGEIRPIGAIDTVKVDVHVIAATHRDLGRMRDAGTFREDLYYRLSVLEMHLPALNARREDIPALADRFLSCACTRLGRPLARLAPAALAALARHDYRGNLRELRNLVERAVALATPGETLTEAHLFGAAPETSNGGWRPLPEEVHIYARSLVRCALDRHGGNRSAAARDLGVSRRWLLQLLKRYRIAGADPE
jgi:sigma-54-dependent transcriptional regulator